MNTKKLLLSSLSLFLLLAPTSQVAAEMKSPAMNVATTNDANLTMAVKDAFASDLKLAKNASQIQITIKDGRVTLSGTVANQQTKDLFKKKAQAVKGVKSVNNSIKVGK